MSECNTTLEDKQDRINIIKQLLIDLYSATNGEIHPKIIDLKEDKATILAGFLIITRDNTEGLKWSDEIETKIDNLVSFISAKEKTYKHMIDYAYQKWDEYKKREKMHYIYKTKIGIQNADGDETKINLYDMSILKFQAESDCYKDTELMFKDPPMFIKDIKRFTHLLLPLNLDSMYLFNSEEKAVIDLKKDEVFLL
jgi:hypothetical protein